MLTADILQRCLPARFKGKLSEENVDFINSALDDEDTREAIRENILGFTSVLNNPYYSIEQYVNAVKYVSYQMMGDTNVKAWAKVFPDKYQRLVAKGTTPKDINSHVSIYNRGLLVNEVRGVSMVPTHILNAANYQAAINKQVQLMNTAKSEMVQMQAANSLLTQLKPPEAKKFELEIGIKQDSMLDELKEVTMALAAKQQAMIQSGVYNAKEIAEQKILTAEYERVEE